MPNARRSSKRIVGVDVSDYEGNLDIEDSKDIDKFPATVEDFNEFIQPKAQSNIVSMVCLRDMVIKIRGQNTGRLYVFNGAGSIIEDMDELDAEQIIQKKSAPSCCGGAPTPYFQILGR